MNARDNGLNVIVGVRKDGESWKQALEDGWVPGETLFPIEEAIDKGTIIMNLLSDAAQSQTWPTLAPLITKGKTLYFSHGFSVVFKDDTHVIPPKDVDVILVAPKGSGRTVRTLFKEGRGINSSIAVWQDVTGQAKEKAIAIGVAVGSGYMYETTFEKEVYSDLYGERGVVSIGIYVYELSLKQPCFYSSWGQFVSLWNKSFYENTNFCQQRVSSWLNTKFCAKTDTPRRKPSMKPLRKLPNLSIL